MVKDALVECFVMSIPMIIIALLFLFEPKWAFDDEEEEE